MYAEQIIDGQILIRVIEWQHRYDKKKGRTDRESYKMERENKFCWGGLEEMNGEVCGRLCPTVE